MNNNYLVAEQVGSHHKIPMMMIYIENNYCYPHRQVFQVLHKHEDIEFLYVIKNQLLVKTLSDEILLKEGEGIFIPKNRLHILNTFGNCVCRGILLHDQLLVPSALSFLKSDIEQITENPLLDFVHIKKGSLVIRKLYNLEAAIKGQDAYEQLSALYGLWHSFRQSIDMDTRHTVNASDKKVGRLRSYLDFIHLHFNCSISITDIANEAYTSVSECNRVFKSILGVTAYDYLIKYRIDKSLDLLKDPTLKVREIGEKVGYTSPSQYIKYFKKHMKMTPKDYRKANYQDT